jgi:hypothetical protein
MVHVYPVKNLYLSYPAPGELGIWIQRIWCPIPLAPRDGHLLTRRRQFHSTYPLNWAFGWFNKCTTGLVKRGDLFTFLVPEANS